MKKLCAGGQARAQPLKWTAAEDAQLRQAVAIYGGRNWRDIARMVGHNRLASQCIQRWRRSLVPGLKKGRWHAEEDVLLVELVGQGFTTWADVADHVPGRTAKQCRERWYQHLHPDVKKGDFSPEEDAIIIKTQAKVGNRWSHIAAHLPGRTENAVKIRWKACARAAAAAVQPLLPRDGQDFKLPVDLQARGRGAHTLAPLQLPEKFKGQFETASAALRQPQHGTTWCAAASACDAPSWSTSGCTFQMPQLMPQCTCPTPLSVTDGAAMLRQLSLRQPRPAMIGDFDSCLPAPAAVTSTAAATDLGLATYPVKPSLRRHSINAGAVATAAGALEQVAAPSYSAGAPGVVSGSHCNRAPPSWEQVPGSGAGAAVTVKGEGVGHWQASTLQQQLPTVTATATAASAPQAGTQRQAQQQQLLSMAQGSTMYSDSVGEYWRRLQLLPVHQQPYFNPHCDSSAAHSWQQQQQAPPAHSMALPEADQFWQPSEPVALPAFQQQLLRGRWHYTEPQAAQQAAAAAAAAIAQQHGTQPAIVFDTSRPVMPQQHAIGVQAPPGAVGKFAQLQAQLHCQLLQGLARAQQQPWGHRPLSTQDAAAQLALPCDSAMLDTPAIAGGSIACASGSTAPSGATAGCVCGGAAHGDTPATAAAYLAQSLWPPQCAPSFVQHSC